jgi:(E)-4-hydroxy-3-methylbut-2-enyl-diphosphate synthase
LVLSKINDILIKGENMERRKTKVIKIGNKLLGGNNPILIQSMCNIKTSKVDQVVKQILSLEDAGCSLIRVSILDEEDAKAIKEIKKQIHIPLIADIHFSYHLALSAIENGADKIRLNPGNLRDKEHLEAIITKAKEKNIPIRIGVNSGSIPQDILEKNDLKLSSSIMMKILDDYVKFFENHQFDNLVIALKASSPLLCLEVNRLAAKKYPYPLHIGVTETSIQEIGLIRSTIALAPLLMEGIGDTIRISLSEDPLKEVEAAKYLLHDLGLYPQLYTLISCPMCGRTTANTKSLALMVKDLLEKYHLNLKVACMGCVVNGIGEGKMADVGIACASEDKYVLFAHGMIIKKTTSASLKQDLESILLSYQK